MENVQKLTGGTLKIVLICPRPICPFMENSHSWLMHCQRNAGPVMDASIPFTAYVPIDFSETNGDLNHVDLADPVECEAYVQQQLDKSNGKVAYGGYLERRGLYRNNPHFNTGNLRNIHLGIDFWALAGTPVLVPFNGTVHSFANNATLGDYGPAIILEHQFGDHTFYSLYGHLSVASLEGLFVRKSLDKGDVLGFLGTADINVGYAPHLHFQLILDIADYRGDYPGVCSRADLSFYRQNCPDPALLVPMP